MQALLECQTREQLLLRGRRTSISGLNRYPVQRPRVGSKPRYKMRSGILNNLAILLAMLNLAKGVPPTPEPNCSNDQENWGRLDDSVACSIALHGIKKNDPDWPLTALTLLDVISSQGQPSGSNRVFKTPRRYNHGTESLLSC